MRTVVVRLRADAAGSNVVGERDLLSAGTSMGWDLAEPIAGTAAGRSRSPYSIPGSTYDTGSSHRGKWSTSWSGMTWASPSRTRATDRVRPATPTGMALMSPASFAG